MSLMLLHLCVCLAGQTRRRSEEEQGDEGGGLPVDERSWGRAKREKQQDWKFFEMVKEKEIKTVQSRK